MSWSLDPNKLLRLKNLVKDLAVADNEQSIRDWIKKIGFPPGRLLGGQRVRFPAEVLEWIEAQPTEMRPAPITENHISKTRRGRRGGSTK